MDTPSPLNPPKPPRPRLIKPSSRRLATALVPRLPGLRLEQINVEEHPDRGEDGRSNCNTVCLTLRATSRCAECPDCHQRASRVHSRYTRTLSDLPWGSFVVRVLLHARRFFCTCTACSRRIFTERLPALVL